MGKKPKKKITRTQHEIMMIQARRNPAFRKAEKEQTMKAEIAIEYISRVLKDQDVAEHLNANADDIEYLGGMEEIHLFLEAFELLTYDYDDHYDENGWLTKPGINSVGREFVEQNDRDKEAELAAKES